MGALVLIAGAFVLSWLLFVLLVTWAAREHSLANKYRAIERGEASKDSAPPGSTDAPPAGQQWIVVYQEGRKTLTTTVSAKSEGEALKTLLKTGGIRYDAIKEIRQK